MLAITNSARISLLRTLPGWSRWRAINALGARFSSNNSDRPSSVPTGAATARTQRRELKDGEHKTLKSLLQESPIVSNRGSLSHSPSQLHFTEESAGTKSPSKRPDTWNTRNFLLSDIEKWEAVLPADSEALAWLIANCSLDNLATGELAQHGAVTLVQVQREKRGYKQIHISGASHWHTIKKNLKKCGLSQQQIEECFPPQEYILVCYSRRAAHVRTSAEVDALVASVKAHNNVTQPTTDSKEESVPPPMHLIPLRRTFWLEMLEEFPSAREMVWRDMTGAGFLTGVFAKEGVLRLWEVKSLYGYQVRYVDSSFIAPFCAELVKHGVPIEFIQERMRPKVHPSKVYPNLTFRKFNQVDHLLSYLQASHAERQLAKEVETVPAKRLNS